MIVSTTESEIEILGATMSVHKTFINWASRNVIGPIVMGSRPKHTIQLQPAMDFKDNKLIALEQEVIALRNRIQHLERLLLKSNKPPAQSMDRTSSTVCAFCQGAHPIRSCEYYRLLQVGDRWSVAKRLGLCFRCLDNENRHLGKYCPMTKVCRIKGCRLLHDRLLHDPDRRKFRAERYRATNPSGPIELGVTSAPYVTAREVPGAEPFGYESDKTTYLDSFSDADSLNSNGDIENSPHACATTACNVDDIDNQQMDELNRLAMLAERELPFDLVFSGSCRNRSQSVHSEYVNPFSSSVDNIEEHILDHNHESGENNSLCISIDSEAHNMDLFISEERPDNREPPGDKNDSERSQTRFVDSLNSFKDHFAAIGPSSGEKVECQNHRYDNEGLDSFDDNLNLFPHVSKPSGGEFFEESIYSQADKDLDSLNYGQANRMEAPYSIENDIACDGNIDSKTDENFTEEIQNTADYSWITSRMDNAVKQLTQKYRTKDSSLLDTLNDQIYKLDEEIALLETPAKEFENRTEIDLSVWLMPDPGGSQKC